MSLAEKPNAVYGTFNGRDVESQNAVTCGVMKSSGSVTDISPLKNLKIGSLFFLWYALNILYNIDNKNALTMLPLPWTVSSLQLFTGWIFFGLTWITGLRRIPRCHTKALFFYTIFPQGVFHLMVHIGAVISLGAGAVSFTHIVKAAEPVVTAFLSGVLLNQVFTLPTYLSLIPVVLGVALASLKELSFTWMSFWCAMISNVGSSTRAIYAKKVMCDKAAVGTDLTPTNIYALLTIVATLVCLPFTLIVEGRVIQEAWNHATGPGGPYTSFEVLSKIFMSGIWYYTYNEVAYMCLDKVNQVTHAVANTLKRVVIIVTSIVVFSTPVSLMGGVGSCVAIVGTFLYSLSKSKYG